MEINRLHGNFSSIQSPILNMHEATVERKKNRKKVLTEPDLGRVAIFLDQLGFERTGKRGQQAP